MDMENCAFMLMGPLSAGWIVVGCLLLVLLLIAVVFYLLKAREVATLKKEVFDLRDTIRMMRYEEANLSRMLHTVSKSAPRAAEAVNAPASENVEVEMEVAVPMEQVREEEQQVAQEEPAVGSMMEEASAEVEDPTVEADEDLVEQTVEELAEEGSAIEETNVEELVDELPVAETQMPEVVVEEAPEVIEDEEEEEVLEEVAGPVEAPEEVAEEVEAPVEDIEMEEEPEVEELAPVATPVQKQSINERRPAIPVDLFSAWFAENEEETAEESAEVESRQVEEPLAPVVSDEAEEAVAPVEQSMEEVAPLEAPVSVVDVEPVAEEPSAPEYGAEEKSAEDDTLSAPAEEPAREPSESGLNKEDERFCRKLERIVSTRLRNPNLNVDTIAAQFGVGRTNFYRKVRELTGMSPNDYLRKYRMERAAELLRTTDLPVSDVCVQVGVPDAQYFSKVFKVYYELTPTAYREKNQINQ